MVELQLGWMNMVFTLVEINCLWVDCLINLTLIGSCVLDVYHRMATTRLNLISNQVEISNTKLMFNITVPLGLIMDIFQVKSQLAYCVMFYNSAQRYKLFHPLH